MGIRYATREAVKAAAQNATTRDDASIDRALDAASRAIEGLTNRRFYPWTGTYKFPWPDDEGTDGWTVWFDGVDLTSLTAASADSGATNIPTADVFPEPNTDGPPYDRIEVDRSSDSVFSAGSTQQRAVWVTGVWGYPGEDIAAGALTTSPNASATTVGVTDASLVGVGDLLLIGTERLEVTGRSWADTGQDLTADLASAANGTTLTVADGTQLHAGEVILIDGEQLLITDVAGNTAVVKRSQNGSTLAAHLTGASLYAARTLTVVRGVLGTTAASHTAPAAVSAWRAPALVVQWVVASTIANLNQQGAGYASSAGSNESQRDIAARALNQLTDQVVEAYARRGRTRAV